MKANRMKAKMLAGQPALGCSVMFPSPQIVEMLHFRAVKLRVLRALVAIWREARVIQGFESRAYAPLFRTHDCHEEVSAARSGALGMAGKRKQSSQLTRLRDHRRCRLRTVVRRRRPAVHAAEMKGAPIGGLLLKRRPSRL
jgi:hypothetical protein